MHKRNILQGGTPIENAKHAMIMIHGRGGDARGIMDIAQYLNLDNFALLAPQATNSTWYPYSFLQPVQQNEPWLSSAIQTVHSLIEEINDKGISSDNIFLLGFSQGACLTLESAARKARRYGGVIAFTGGLIGDAINQDNYSGNFNDSPIYIGSGDPDPHVPVQRVKESAIVLHDMGAAVTAEIFPGIGHTITREELDWVNYHMLPPK
jgi:phospholipase/carboxylesterase